MLTPTTRDHELVGERLQITYQPVNQDLANGSMSFGDPESVEIEVVRANDTRATGEADDGRMVSTPLTDRGNKTVRARATDRDQGTFRQHLGHVRDVERVSLTSFDILRYGDKIVYIGPERLPSPFAAPIGYKQPYTFCHVSAGGTLKCETKFNEPQSLSPDHPANTPANWRRAQPEEVSCDE
jgi:hypothetical protein